MAETSTPSIRVFLDHPRTPSRSRQGLQFEISDAMKKSKATKLFTSYHDPRQPGTLGGMTRFARAQKLPVTEVRETLERDLGYTLHKTPKTTFSYPSRDGVWYRRAMGVRSDRSDQHFQVQSRLQVSIDSGRRVFKVRLGRTRQDQDWT